MNIASPAGDLAEVKTLPNFAARGTNLTSCRMRRFGARSIEEPQKAVVVTIEGLRTKKPICVGPLKDNKTGKAVIDRAWSALSALGVIIATPSAWRPSRDMPGELWIAK